MKSNFNVSVYNVKTILLYGCGGLTLAGC